MYPAPDVVVGRDSSAELLPAALVDLSYIPPEDHAAERLASWYCTSNGIAAGLSPADTILHALYEVIERDALGALLASVMAETPHGHSVTMGGRHRLAWLARCIEDDFATGIEVRRLPSLSGHVVAAISTTTDSRGCVVLGCGASARLAYAVERAVLELAQNLVAEVQGELFSADGLPDSLARLHPFPNLLAAARLDRLPPRDGMIALGEGRHDFLGPVPSVEQQALTALEALSAAGFQAYARPLYRPSSAGGLAPQVWQVAVPGVERFHLVRLGLPVEPTGRLRTKALIALARQPIDRSHSRSTHGSDDVLPLP
jgi:ribosomal protein S12 methylthiotransferase accessory factor